MVKSLSSALILIELNVFIHINDFRIYQPINWLSARFSTLVVNIKIHSSLFVMNRDFLHRSIAAKAQRAINRRNTCVKCSNLHKMKENKIKVSFFP